MDYIICFFFPECTYVAPTFDLQSMCFLLYILVKQIFKVSCSVLASNLRSFSLTPLGESNASTVHWFSRYTQTILRAQESVQPSVVGMQPIVPDL